MRPAGILETVLYAADLDAAEAFYEKVLGLERVARVDDRHVFFACGNQMLLIFNPAVTRQPPKPGMLPVPPHGAEGQCHMCFRASRDELAQWQAHLEAHGVAIESVVDWPQGGRSIYFRDPAGNSIEFAEPRIWGFS
ncbi:VOC family protein [Rhodoligotrophos defluvii]|uniref:VOC family protein n=1 Tax=Rhodoligotrophos defluvii TaxID=2561934 RepID=UPI0010C9C56A|nr:VOC family protein [Rhodoligotrophos defluvii]